MTTPMNPEENGRQSETFVPGKSTVGLERVLIGEVRRQDESRGNGYLTAADELIALGSTNVRQAVTMGRHSMQEFARIVGTVAHYNWVYALHSDIGGLVNLKIWGWVGAEGLGRKEYLAYKRAEMDREERMRKGWNGMYDRFNDNGSTPGRLDRERINR